MTEESLFGPEYSLWYTTTVGVLFQPTGAACSYILTPLFAGSYHVLFFAPIAASCVFVVIFTNQQNDLPLEQNETHFLAIVSHQRFNNAQ